MSRSLRYNNPELRNLLASNYVIGTLTGLARKRLQTLMQDDPELRNLVIQWEEKLQPLNYATLEVAPKKETLQNIFTAINGAVEPLLEQLKKRLRIYQYVTVGALAASMAMFAIMVWAPSEELLPPPLNYVAVLNDDLEQPAMVVSITKNEQGRLLALDMLKNLP